MKLIRINVENYRRFINETIKFGNDVTVIAGSNNSGKTSLIDLLRTVFGKKTGKLPTSYIPIEAATKWTNQYYDLFMEKFKESEYEDDRINELYNYIYSEDKDTLTQAHIIPCTIVKIEIGYEKNEDISLFSNYLYSFEDSSTSLYFMFSLELDIILFRKNLKAYYNKLDRKYRNLVNPEKVNNIGINENATKDILFEIYYSSLVEKYYYTDETYQYRTKIEGTEFKELFHFQNIYASRELDDEDNSKSNSLSKKVIELANLDDSWNEMIEGLPDLILDQLIATDLRNIMKETSSKSLDSATTEVARINGISAAKLSLDIDLNENHVRELIGKAVTSKFILDNFIFNESSQGLGYSNMIYILLQLESYRTSIDSERMNFFIIEEPESHMHPQMQRVFSKYLKEYYESYNIQGILTTHSNEIIKTISIKNLRVVRPLSNYKSGIYDFSIFKSDGVTSELNDFYNHLYELGFSDIVFADKAILYEGNTERLLIKKIIASEEYNYLKYAYIAYIQVGGEYAFKYSELLQFLGIKALILTDIDYPKNVSSLEDINLVQSSNSTLNYFYGAHKKPTIKDLIEWEEESNNIVMNGKVNIQFQNDRTSYARTLEEAMLSKKLGINVLEKKERDFWRTLKSTSNLNFSIPNQTKSISIQDIVNSTSKNKIDFIYSVILSDSIHEMIPTYIHKGLEWLGNDK